MKNTGWGSESSANSEKTIIHYARFGKILRTNKLLVYIQIIISVSISVVFILNSDLISYTIASTSLDFLDSAKLKSGTIAEFLKINYLEYEGRFPSLYESIVYMFASLIVMLFTYKSDLLPALVRIYINFFFLVLLSSSLFFYIFPHEFPYSSNTFSALYVIVQIGILSFIPTVLGIALAPLNISPMIFFLNFLVIVFTLMYSLLFGTVRYIAVLYILNEFSYIWMANLFFNLGPFLDMIYISGIYSFYLSILSNRYGKEVAYWRWIY